MYMFSSEMLPLFLWSAELQVIFFAYPVPKGHYTFWHFEIPSSVFQADITETRSNILVTPVIMAQEGPC